MWVTEVTCFADSRSQGHTGIVNSCCPARRGTTVVSGSDDGTIKIWDTRRRGAVATLDSKYQVTAVCFSEDATKAFSGGIDNVVKVRAAY
jgi:Prp8 binding protein